jgi:hypothetical protein
MDSKALEEFYFEGFCKNYWDEDYLAHNGAYYNDQKVAQEYNSELNVLERSVYGDVLEGDEAFKTKEFQAALKRWNQVKASPLYEALK